MCGLLNKIGLLEKKEKKNLMTNNNNNYLFTLVTKRGFGVQTDIFSRSSANLCFCQVLGNSGSSAGDKLWPHSSLLHAIKLIH